MNCSVRYFYTSLFSLFLLFCQMKIISLEVVNGRVERDQIKKHMGRP